MRDPKSEKTIKDVEAEIEKMFMEIAQDKIGKYTSPLMIDNHLPSDTSSRNEIIKNILENLKKRIDSYRGKKLQDEGQERKRQLAIDKIEEKIKVTYELSKKNSDKTTYRLPMMIQIDKIPFDEIIVSSIIKERLGY